MQKRQLRSWLLATDCKAPDELEALHRVRGLVRSEALMEGEVRGVV
jgi:hypothetical protein